MKAFFLSITAAILLFGAGWSGNRIDAGELNVVPANKEKGRGVSPKADGGCGNSLLFKQGAEIRSVNYDWQGKETTRQQSVITKVYQQNGSTVSECDMKTTDPQGGNEKKMRAVYKCDGKQFFIDLSGFMADNKQQSKVETSGLFFPLRPSVGEVLPDADYNVNMTMGGKSVKIVSHIRERKVEAKEKVTTAAGTFDCFRVSSIIETENNIPGMDEKARKMMEEMKKKMGKNKMTFWYSPDVTVIKMEFYMGERLITRNEVTAIKK